jgi:hypothetical protein
MDGLSACRVCTIALISLLFVSPSFAVNNPGSCDNTGKYCFADKLYDCVNGKPVFAEDCQYKCNKGECIVYRMEPTDSFTYIEPEVTKTESSDVIFYISLTMVIMVIMGLYIRIKLHNRKQRKK